MRRAIQLSRESGIAEKTGAQAFEARGRRKCILSARAAAGFLSKRCAPSAVAAAAAAHRPSSAVAGSDQAGR